MCALYGPKVWAAPIVYLIALLGTWLLANESARPWAVLLLIASAVVLWGRQNWIPAFPSDVTTPRAIYRSRLFYLFGATIAMLLALAADLRYAAAPTETFGLAGILWIAGIALLLCSAFFGSRLLWGVSTAPRLPRWPTWEMALLAALFGLALFSRVWNLTNFPHNIYPDEIMTVTVATQSYISPTTPPSVFSTLWSGIDLPALWFWFVAVFLKLGGTSLAMLRLPAALFGAATVVSLYALLRETWGRYAAIAGSAIMAFSASNVHYSRLALNNIVTQFFWATCFFFLLRALRSRRPRTVELGERGFLGHIRFVKQKSPPIVGWQASASDIWRVEGDPKVVVQEIQFTNGDAHLTGTVYLPESGDHLPAVVALHGASEPTRKAAFYRHLREGLPAMGVSVLVYDRRGTGASSGSLKNIDYGTLADDAMAGQRALGDLPRIDRKRIGFWGFSQGGWLALLAASRSTDTAFAISVSAPLVTPEQQMQFATTNLLNVRGYSQENVKQMLETRKAWTDYLKERGHVRPRLMRSRRPKSNLGSNWRSCLKHPSSQPTRSTIRGERRWTRMRSHRFAT